MLDTFTYAVLVDSLGLDQLIKDVGNTFEKDLMSKSNMLGYVASGKSF